MVLVEIVEMCMVFNGFAQGGFVWRCFNSFLHRLLVVWGVC